VSINKKTPLALRLERLRAATGQTWDTLATRLGVKPAMIFHVLSGRRGFSEKTLAQLQECEVAEGLRTEASVLIEQGLTGADLLETLLNADELTPVTIKDIDLGWKVMPLEYRRGSPSPGFPIRTKVTAPDNTEIWQILGANSAQQSSPKFLSACLPELKDRPEVLKQVTPTCYGALFNAAMDLAFGLNWRSKLQPADRNKKKP
jgi:transcriptional regulator with XRE-family HTH domain